MSTSVSGEGGRWIVRGAAFAAGALLVAGLLALAWSAASVLVLVFVALVIATALEPVTDRLRDRLPTGRAGTIIVAYAALLFLLGAFAVVLVPLVATEAGRVIAQLPATLADAEAWARELESPVAATIATTALRSATEAFERSVSIDPDAVFEVGIEAAGIVIGIATVLGLAFFWLVERARLQRYVLAFVPEPRRANTREAWNTVTERLGKWVRGQLILMAAMGVATGIAYTVLGVPAPLLLAVIAAITEVIPIIGPLLGAIPAIVVAATVSPELAVIVAFVYIGIQVVEGLVLVPLVMRNTVGLSPFLILVSVLIGSAVAGIAGALLAVPMAATLEIILGNLQDREEPVAIDPTAARDDDPDPQATPVAPG